MSTQTGFDLDGLTRAIQRHDCQYHLALFSDNAQVEILDSAQPDAPVQVLSNKPAIGAWLDGIASTAERYELRDAVVHPGRVGYVEECRYADGSKVLLECDAEVRSGQISRATVTLRHISRCEAVPQPAPTPTRTAERATTPVPPSHSSARPRTDRHLPGNFLG